MSLRIYIQVIVNGKSQNLILQNGEQVSLGRDMVMAANKTYTSCPDTLRVNLIVLQCGAVGYILPCGRCAKRSRF